MKTHKHNSKHTKVVHLEHPPEPKIAAPVHTIEQAAEHKPAHAFPKHNNALIAVAAILAIFLITYFAVNYNSIPIQNTDASGQAYDVLLDVSGAASCKLLVSQTTLYDDSTLSVTLSAGDATYYSGYTVSVDSVNDNGCVVDINGASDYLVVGQIQRLGAVYVTVKDVVI